MDCCHPDLKSNSCIRTSDMKKFGDLNKRKYTRKQCLDKPKPIKSFSVRASCAPYKDCDPKKMKKMKKIKKMTRKKK